MRYVFYAKGHPNITSKHRSTFEITKDKEIGKAADCIIGVGSQISMEDFPMELKKAIAKKNATIKVLLKTENAEDEITGKGHPDLTLDHPTDIVCRKSDYICDRTLMIKADKAACDLKRELIEDLKKGSDLRVKIIIK
ncbi:MAG TPA: DUF371 domain-containing protein [Methanothermobacter sp.]|nr:putative conserved hypothetical protein [Methanothermobacter sp. MT-2]HHW05033.1 DUF371 domain-containing protein [Methanothermobacter sp.]HOK72539.1 DUF371 domain-containing protein [Methanothermobacter sp.]HOL69398.1 DUF371 domain-containing protein [Methanothermobacter sp.]HPQ04026.1 DUF371 domain-containing protein [Methanothermobacter sp.]